MSTCLLKGTATTIPGQSGPESNINKGILQPPQNSGTGDSPPDAFYCHTQDTLIILRRINSTHFELQRQSILRETSIVSIKMQLI